MVYETRNIIGGAPKKVEVSSSSVPWKAISVIRNPLFCWVFKNRTFTWPGKLLHNYGKITMLLMGKSTNYRWPFWIAMFVDQRVPTHDTDVWKWGINWIHPPIYGIFMGNNDHYPSSSSGFRAILFSDSEMEMLHPKIWINVLIFLQEWIIKKINLKSNFDIRATIHEPKETCAMDTVCMKVVTYGIMLMYFTALRNFWEFMLMCWWIWMDMDMEV